MSYKTQDQVSVFSHFWTSHQFIFLRNTHDFNRTNPPSPIHSALSSELLRGSIQHITQHIVLLPNHALVAEKHDVLQDLTTKDARIFGTLRATTCHKTPDQSATYHDRTRNVNGVHALYCVSPTRQLQATFLSVSVALHAKLSARTWITDSIQYASQDVSLADYEMTRAHPVSVELWSSTPSTYPPLDVHMFQSTKYHCQQP